MTRLSWFRRGNLRKFEDYTAWSLYLLLAMLPLIMAQWNRPLSEANSTLTTVFWVLVLAETVTAILVIHDAVVGLRESRPPRRVLTVIVLAIGLVTLAVAAVTLRGADTGSGEAKYWIPLIVIGFAVGVASASISIRQAYVAVVASIIVVVASWRYVGLNDGNLLVNTIGPVFFMGLTTISVRASIAMLRLMHEIDRSRAVASQLAVAEERLRFARDLHDTLGRNLSAMALKSQLAKQLVRRDVEASAQEIGAVQRLAEESLTEMRAVVQGYRDVDLPAELRGAQSLLRSANIDSRIDIDPGSLPPELHDGVGWVVREAVTNVIRHSTATSCTIEAEPANGGFVIRVTNDHPNPARTDGVGGLAGTGIAGLAQRIAPLGGTVSPKHSADEFVLSASFKSAAPSPASGSAVDEGTT